MMNDEVSPLFQFLKGYNVLLVHNQPNTQPTRLVLAPYGTDQRFGDDVCSLGFLVLTNPQGEEHIHFSQDEMEETVKFFKETPRIEENFDKWEKWYNTPIGVKVAAFIHGDPANQKIVFRCWAELNPPEIRKLITRSLLDLVNRLVEDANKMEGPWSDLEYCQNKHGTVLLHVDNHPVYNLLIDHKP